MPLLRRSGSYRGGSEGRLPVCAGGLRSRRPRSCPSRSSSRSIRPALIADRTSTARSHLEGRGGLRPPSPRYAALRSAAIKRARPRSSLAPLLARTARLLRIGVHNQRRQREWNLFLAEPLPPRPGRVAADRAAARDTRDLREPRVPPRPRSAVGPEHPQVARDHDRGSGPRAPRVARARGARVRRPEHDAPEGPGRAEARDPAARGDHDHGSRARPTASPP